MLDSKQGESNRGKLHPLTNMQHIRQYNNPLANKQIAVQRGHHIQPLPLGLGLCGGHCASDRQTHIHTPTPRTQPQQGHNRAGCLSC